MEVILKRENLYPLKARRHCFETEGGDLIFVEAELFTCVYMQVVWEDGMQVWMREGVEQRLQLSYGSSLQSRLRHLSICLQLLGNECSFMKKSHRKWMEVRLGDESAL